MSLVQIAKKHGIARASVCRVIREADDAEPRPSVRDRVFDTVSPANVQPT
jgi:hypothetical protein